MDAVIRQYVLERNEIVTESLKMVVWKVLILAMGASTAVFLARWMGPDLRGELAIFLMILSLGALVFQPVQVASA
jgi:O-antigen/teichoic acid export membrane protein